MFDPEEIDCPCQSDGWVNVDDVWEECRTHFHGQLHPECRELLLDEPALLVKAEKESILSWRIEQAKEKIADLQIQIRHAQFNLHTLELEKINKTPTVQIQAVKLPLYCYPTVQITAVRPEFDHSNIFED